MERWATGQVSPIDVIEGYRIIDPMVQEVPSPIDLTDMTEASRWAAEAGKRPGRAEMLRRFAMELSSMGIEDVLELGSGPGFLAEIVLNSLPDMRYVALDFSGAMHELAKARLGERAGNVCWLQRDFRAASWSADLPKFSAVITNQAVHELRHKSRVADLHRSVRQLLKDGGLYLMCDHWHGDGGMANADLYMTVEEQRAALTQAGFEEPKLIAKAGTLALFRSKK